MKPLPIPDIPTPLKRFYSNLRGVDFINRPSHVDSSRSPDALNVWKDYASTAGRAIETRPGFKKIVEYDAPIYGIHRYKNSIYIHTGNKLIGLGNYELIDANAVENEIISTSLNPNKSISFEFSDCLYLIDGIHYWKYDGITFEEMSDANNNVYIPITRINADPDGGNGKTYNEVNLISDYRINTFVGDGKSTVYYLDDTYDNEKPVVKVNGISVEVKSFDYSNGTVTLSAAPPEPMTSGEDNVEIKYKKHIDGSADIVRTSNICEIFDNRVFVASPTVKIGYITHSGVEDPSYFPCDREYNGTGTAVKITGLVVGHDKFFTIKDNYGNGEKVCIHTTALDYDLGKIFPITSTGIRVGGFCAVNFKDEIVYLTELGLESVVVSSDGARLYHKSSFVDLKLTTETQLSEAVMSVWRGYLCIIINGHMFLADSRQKHTDFGTLEYEWYYWDNLICEGEAAKKMLICDEDLFFCTDKYLCKLTGTNDNGAAINAYWSTPHDMFGYPAYLKTTNKKGGMCIIKPLANSKIKIACKTDREEHSLLAEYETDGFDFNEFDFETLDFSTTNKDLYFFKAKKKKISWFSLKFYSDELDKPFGLYEAGIEYSIKKHAKEK